MTEPYPKGQPARQRIRDRKISERTARARTEALALVTSIKCGIDLWPRHAGTPEGCANDGSTCLCECHDA
jgi:hypothetical protein